MDRNSMKRCRVIPPSLLIAAGFAAMHGVSACGNASSPPPASELAEPVGASGSTGAAALCDGSDDVRFLWVLGGSDGISGYPSFARVRGGGFLAIDGQCRFWTARGPTERVTSGTLSVEAAAAFVAAVGYQRFAEYAPLNDEQPPAGGEICIMGTTRIWSPESRAHCRCACTDEPTLDGWRRVLDATVDPAVQGLFASGQAVATPLRLALISVPRLADEPTPWPLPRAPAPGEIYDYLQLDTLPLEESSGVEITDPGELLALRAARDGYTGGSPPDYTPVVWTDPGTQQPVWFHMVLRDELPAHVQAALARPLF